MTGFWYNESGPEDDWNKVIWSDETKINIFGSDSVKFVRRRPAEDFLTKCTTVTIKRPASIMVWSSMNSHRFGRLAIIEGNINTKKYKEAVLEAKLLKIREQSSILHFQ